MMTLMVARTLDTVLALVVAERIILIVRIHTRV